MNCNASLVCKSAKHTGDAMTGWVGKSWRWGGAIALSRHFGQPVRCGNKFKLSGAKITVLENTELPLLLSEIIIKPLFSSCPKNIRIFWNNIADLNMPWPVSVSIYLFNTFVIASEYIGFNGEINSENCCKYYARNRRGPVEVLFLLLFSLRVGMKGGGPRTTTKIIGQYRRRPLFWPEHKLDNCQKQVGIFVAFRHCVTCRANTNVDITDT